MTSRELQKVINKHLFVPIEEDLTERLIAVSNSLTAAMDSDAVDKWSRAFFMNSVSPSFKNMFVAQYKLLYDEEPYFPPVVFEILETFQVLLAIQSDDLDSDLREQFSLIVRNNAVWRKGNWYGLLCPEWIEQMYVYYSNDGDKTLKYTYDYEILLKAVASHNTWAETGLEISDAKVYNQLRSLCTSVVRGKVKAFAETPAFRNLSSPFAQVYLLVNKMVNDWQWKYIDKSPVRRIKSAMGDNCKKRKMLSGIANEVRDQLRTDLTVPTMDSSVLLARIATGEVSSIDGRQFTVLEFGIYLYYELLLESFND